MSMYSNRLQPPLQNLLQRVVRFFHPEIVMSNVYICGRLWQTKITRKASDAAEYIELFGSFTRDRHARGRIYRWTFRE